MNLDAQSWWKKLLLVAAAFSVAILLSELVVRFSGVARNVGPSFTVFDPVYGKRLKKSFSCRRIAPEFTMRFSTNSLGFRGPEPDGKPVGGVVFLGDSFTLGYGVNDGQEFPQLVGEALAERFGALVPVVNMGLANNGNGRWVKFLRNGVGRYEPRLVVLQFCGNDFADNVLERLFELDAQGRLVELPVSERSPLRRVQGFVEAIPGLSYSRLVSYAKQIRYDARRREGMENQGRPTRQSTREAVHARERLAYALIDEALALCAARGWRVIVLSVSHTDPQRADLEAICQRHGVDLIALPGKEERPELYYEIDGHWRASGHRHVAEVITRRILEDEQ